MDLEFFEKLTEAEVRLFLESFLQESGRGFRETVPELERGGCCIDYSLDSIPAVFEWLKSKIRTFPKQPDPSLPDWLRQSEGYKKNLFEFDDKSKVLILRIAYYLGEAFDRSSDKLCWATGNRKFAQQNEPVITGFKYEKELSPMAMAESLCSGFISGSKSVSDVSSAVENWRSYIPD